MTTSELDKTKTILFYDGSCGFCQRVIQLSIKLLKKNADIYFAPLEGSTAKSSRKTYENFPNEINAIVLLNNNIISIGPNAFFELASFYRKPWSILRYLKYLPKLLANSIYRIIAVNRYRFFGKNKTCIIPNEEFKTRFLK
jgi:predicted DCC family thiol-disulfide oxidoreductase YuxK